MLLNQHLELEERHWWFVARRRVLLSLLERHLGVQENLEVLDAGCGGGATMESLRRYGRVRGMELSEVAVAHNREQGREVVQGAIEEIPFADGAFDLALALDVIEHVPDDHRALRELLRVLRPGGHVLVSVPALRMLWSAHDEANGHYRRYTRDGLRDRVEAAGFEPVTATYFNALLFPVVLVARSLGRLRRKTTASDLGEVPRPLNAALKRIFSLEARIIGRVAPPVGVSALCLARKPGTLEKRVTPE